VTDLMGINVGAERGGEGRGGRISTRRFVFCEDAPAFFAIADAAGLTITNLRNQVFSRLT
jgi:hypothetical protein